MPSAVFYCFTSTFLLVSARLLPRSLWICLQPFSATLFPWGHLYLQRPKGRTYCDMMSYNTGFILGVSDHRVLARVAEIKGFVAFKRAALDLGLRETIKAMSRPRATAHQTPPLRTAGWRGRWHSTQPKRTGTSGTRSHMDPCVLRSV